MAIRSTFPSTRSPRLPQLHDQPGHELAKRLLDRLGGGDRLGEAQGRARRLLRHNRLQGLGAAAERLIEAQKQGPAEAALERPARQLHEVADRL
jgi:hypothetical protein